RKGSSSEEHIQGGKKAMAAGFQLSEYWMPGLGGTERWESHAKNTARVLNEINPHYIRSRPFRTWPGTPMHAANARGEFEPLGPAGQLNEIKVMIEALEVESRVCFDHAGNFWRNPRGALLFSQSYEGYQFPGEKQALLDLIGEGMQY
ncbi:MAG: radical SAM protein, partial [Desulfobacterales bacterium]|nr:radical SAM protein [Desulfobacterales bacterium]